MGHRGHTKRKLRLILKIRNGEITLINYVHSN